MGHLLYGSPPEALPFDDRTLAHLEIVVFAKLRRHESFALSVTTDVGLRRAVWINPSSTLTFAYEGPGGDINRDWLERLADAANSPSGLRVVPEPA